MYKKSQGNVIIKLDGNKHEAKKSGEVRKSVPWLRGGNSGDREEIRKPGDRLSKGRAWELRTSQ